MDGRKTVWLLTLSLTTLCAGCITTQAQKTTSNPGIPQTPVVEETPRVKRDDGPKRNPKAATEVAFAKMKEAEADADAAKQKPEAQAVVRDESRKAYQQALKIDPNNLEAYRGLGQLYTKMGDTERAQETFKKAMAKHPKDAGLWYDLGQCHNRRKDFAEGARCFNKAVELDPENREYLKKLGFTLAWSGQIDQGLVYLTRAHGSPTAHLMIACMFDQKEQRAPAIHHLKLALNENPQLQAARDLLAALENPGTPRAPQAAVALR